MGEALFELEQVLSSKKEKLTSQEANILLSCKSKAARDFTSSAIAGGTVVWAATWKLSKVFRMNLSAGAGAFIGLWILGRSLDSCADHILTLDGSRLQKELTNIMLRKYQNDPWRMKLISKHFYAEKIFDDSTTDNPKLRLRYRNFYSDNVVHGHRPHEHNSSDNSEGDSHIDSHGNAHGKPENDTDSKRRNLETKHVFVNPGSDMMAEPDFFDSLFGAGAPVEEIHLPNFPNKPPATHNRSHRRSHHRRRMHNH